MAEENPEEKQEKQEPLVKKDANAIRAELGKSGDVQPRKARKKRRQTLEIPDSTRLTFFLFPPYGLAWLWTNKKIDREMKLFGSIGMSIYMLLWFIPVALWAYTYVITNS